MPKKLGKGGAPARSESRRRRLGSDPGGRPSFREVYKETATRVTGMLRRMNVAPDDIDDVVQEVFLTVHRRLADFEGRSSVATWVVGIAKLVAQNYRRTQRRKAQSQRLDLDLDTVVDTRADTSERAYRAQAELVIREGLRELRSDDAALLVQVELEGTSPVQLARRTNENVNTVYSRLRHARQELEGALARKGLAIPLTGVTSSKRNEHR